MSDHLAAAIQQALRALEDHGIGPERVVLAITDPHVEGQDTAYDTHVGATEDRRLASLLSLLAQDLLEETRLQGVALADLDSTCPSCGSQRWGPRRARRDPRPGQPPGIYVAIWDECMDCGHKGPER